MISPTTHVIYSIWGIGKVAKGTAQKEQDVLMELLSKKYGPPQESFMVKEIVQGKRRVLTKAETFVGEDLEIRYYDQEVQDIAEKERLAIETKKADGSGL